jgi:hypothetical protein
MSDFGSLLGTQAGLNPWLVVLLSSIAGLLAFAVSNALYVLHTRHKRVVAALENPWVVRLRHAMKAYVVALAAIVGILAMPGPKLLENRGWLSGDDLFAVSSRAGFVASYPSTSRKVAKGDVILQLVRDAAPDEIAAAANQRALLVQDLEFTKLETLRVDALLLAAHTTEKDSLDDLIARKQALTDNRESLVRGVRRQEMSDVETLEKVRKELQAARFELAQTEASFKLATTSFEIARNPDVAGLFSGDEMVKREERVAVLGSRRAELRERIALLTNERRRLEALTAASDETHAEQVTQRVTELEELETEIAVARERVAAAWRAIEQDKLRAERQRDYRIRQIELKIAEHDSLLDARQSALDIQAPWDGIVGFREPSPASARIGNRPLLVLYKPGSIAVKLRVGADETWLDGARDVAIELQAMIPEAANATYSGIMGKASLLPDGTGELQIVGDPPEAAIRELATGASVPVHVVIRQLNPVVAAGLGWFWWLTIAVLAGCAYGEARFRWLQRSSPAKDADVPNPRALAWGGDSDEFLEYVVDVGVVWRKIPPAMSPVEVTEDRWSRESAMIAAAPRARASLQG